MLHIRLRAPVAVGFWMLAALLASSAPSFANQLAQWLFMHEMGKQAGAAVSAYTDYKETREMWRNNAEAARLELERCGGCPAAQAELDKWNRVENQFQAIAGPMASSVGMPPIVADWLGIELGGSRTYSPEAIEERRVVRPAWIDDSPAFCQAPSDSYIACLQGYQATEGMFANLDDAKAPGGQCYDLSKLYRYCGSGNYEGFRHEVEAQRLRREGAVLPEVYHQGPDHMVYYGQVPVGFVPDLPPQAVVFDYLETEDAQALDFYMVKPDQRWLSRIQVRRFFHNAVFPGNPCYSVDRPTVGPDAAVCEDIRALSQAVRPPIVLCAYGETIRIYWLGGRPSIAEPERLRSRATEHPLLLIGGPRNGCPMTLSPEAVEASFAPGGVVMDVSQTPEALRRDAARRKEAKARDDAAANLVGTYSVEGRNLNGSRYSGSAVISYEGHEIYTIEWSVGGERYSGRGWLQGNTWIVESGARYTIVFTREPDGSIAGIWNSGEAEQLTPQNTEQESAQETTLAEPADGKPLDLKESVPPSPDVALANPDSRTLVFNPDSVYQSVPSLETVGIEETPVAEPSEADNQADEDTPWFRPGAIWRGSVSQPGYGDYTIEIQLNADGSGRIDYPSIPCQGRLTAEKLDAAGGRFLEKTLSGACFASGKVELRLRPDGAVDYRYDPGGYMGLVSLDMPAR